MLDKDPTGLKVLPMSINTKRKHSDERNPLFYLAGRGHNYGWTRGGEQVQPGSTKPARGRAGEKKYTKT